MKYFFKKMGFTPATGGTPNEAWSYKKKKRAQG